MKQFTPLLKGINDRLDLPQPTKSRIILEIAADLGDLYQLYLARGMSENEAAQKAEEKFDLTDEALNELVQIHQSLFRKLLDKITAQAQNRWEKAVFMLMFIFIIAISLRGILSTQFFLQASKWIYPVLGIFLTAILISIPKFYQLYVKKDHRARTLKAVLIIILILGAVNLFVGIFGYLIELYSAGSRGLLVVSHLLYIITINSPESTQILMNITEWMIKSSSLIMVCLLTTIFTALIWYVLINKINKIEQAEALVLLAQ